MILTLRRLRQRLLLGVELSLLISSNLGRLLQHAGHLRLLLLQTRMSRLLRLDLKGLSLRRLRLNAKRLRLLLLRDKPRLLIRLSWERLLRHARHLRLLRHHSEPILLLDRELKRLLLLWEHLILLRWSAGPAFLLGLGQERLLRAECAKRVVHEVLLRIHPQPVLLRLVLERLLHAMRSRLLLLVLLGCRHLLLRLKLSPVVQNVVGHHTCTQIVSTTQWLVVHLRWLQWHCHMVLLQRRRRRRIQQRVDMPDGLVRTVAVLQIDAGRVCQRRVHSRYWTERLGHGRRGKRTQAARAMTLGWRAEMLMARQCRACKRSLSHARGRSRGRDGCGVGLGHHRDWRRWLVDGSHGTHT